MRERISDLESGRFGDLGHTVQGSPDGSLTYFRKKAADIEAAWPDSRLVDAYERTSGTPGDHEADAILAEIQHRNLDI
jgi:hypothetical protein